MSKRNPPAKGPTPRKGPARKSKTTKVKRPKGTKTTKVGRTTKVAKAAKKKENEQQLEPITPFKRGLSIGVKFAGLTACVVGLFMGLLGWLTYSIAGRNLDAQITEQGVQIVSTLENAIDRRIWIQQEPPQPKKGEPPPKMRDLDAERAQRIANWERRLKRMVETSNDQIVAVSIIHKDRSDKNKQEQVAQWPRKQLSVADQRVIKETGEGDELVIVYEGLMEGKRVRRFDKKIPIDMSREKEITELLEKVQLNGAGTPAFEEANKRLNELTGQELGHPDQWKHWRAYEQPPSALHESAERADPWVAVFVRAGRLDSVKAEMQSRIGVVTLCGAVAGILLTVLISAVLTGPIRELETDISEVASGNLQHQSRVRSTDEIGSLAHVFNIMTRNLKTAQNNAVERQAFERELNIAKEIQEKLLPERIPQIPGLDIESHYNSAKEVGGDYYDFIVIDQTHLGIIVADVAGKGIPGAMVMTMARSLVRLASVRNVSPGDTFKKVNRILAKDIRRGMFVTAAYMVLNVKTKVLKVASAGHNPVVLYRAKSDSIELVKPKGIALGFDKGTIFDNNIQEAEVQLEPGDRIVSYTDGVNEAMNNDSEEFGDDRFYELSRVHAQKSSKEFIEALVAALDEHRGSAEQSDDITITTLKVGGKA